MENFSTLAIVSIIGSGIGWLFGGWTISLTVLSIFMSVEIISRIISHIVNKNRLSADAVFKQFYRKITIMMVIILANALDMLVGDGTPIFKSITVMYYTGYEGLAIRENIKAVDIKIPNVISDKLEQMEKEDNK